MGATNNADLLAQIGSVYFRARQFPTAIEYYQRAVNVKPTAPLLVSLSNSYHYAGLDDRVIATLNRALEVDPKWGDAQEVNTRRRKSLGSQLLTFLDNLSALESIKKVYVNQGSEN
jgi:tetratricopeptide (TPR) repeat protein